MTVVWCDTETTGLDPWDSGPFELAFLVYRDSHLLDERVFYLNPLSDEVRIHQDALELNGATEEQIRSYPPADEVVPEITAFFKKYAPPEKMVFAGYNCPFDYGHLGALLFRSGVIAQDFFNERFIDVLELINRAKDKGLLGDTMNNKLESMTKALGIVHEGAHTALSDIKATRRLYEAIYILSRRKNEDRRQRPEHEGSRKRQRSNGERPGSGAENIAIANYGHSAGV
jgi:DNA polymerase III epsilon subunit-like protein